MTLAKQIKPSSDLKASTAYAVELTSLQCLLDWQRCNWSP
jgi:hypothetical protein